MISINVKRDKKMDAMTRMPLKLFQVFQSVNVFLDHIQIMYDTKGITFEGMDPSHVCLIKASIAADEWVSYRLLYGVPGSFGISLKHLTHVLKHATGDDEMVFRYDPNEKKAVFHVELKGPDRSVAIPLPLIDIEEDSLDIPEVEYGFMMSLFPKVWHSYISTFDVIEPHTVSLFPTHKTTEFMTVKGEGELSDMSMTIRADRGIKADDPALARKDLTRYTKITKADGPSFEVPLSAPMMK
jgi:DNA polymerase III sliding clamp (beta) subunit (PCNA family)